MDCFQKVLVMVFELRKRGMWKFLRRVKPQFKRFFAISNSGGEKIGPGDQVFRGVKIHKSFFISNLTINPLAESWQIRRVLRTGASD